MLELNGQAVTYDMEGEGVPLLFIHQVATDRRLWRYQRMPFSQRYCFIAVDVMGHGNVAWSPGGFFIDYATEQIRKLMERLKTGPAFVIGVSMGAIIAMKLALCGSSPVRGLILVSPWGHDTSKYTKNLVERLFRLAEEGDRANHADLFLRYVLPPTYLERHAAEFEGLRTLIMEQDAKAVAYSWAACLASDLTGTLKDIQVPSLVISGLKDLFTPPYLARTIASELSEVELEVWEEAGHFPFFEDPARFNRRLETFIRRCLSQSALE